LIAAPLKVCQELISLKTDSHALDSDTIVAIATPSGRGGICVIRLSGPAAKSIGEHVTQRPLTPRTPIYSRFFDQNNMAIDEGIVLYFVGPASFTGEDVTELHGHGGVVIADMLLEICLNAGARLARPGEFSERAFLNNKMDLTQAEGLADIIDAPTRRAARQASASLRGDFSTAVTDIAAQLIQVRVYIEAAIDFPEEEIDFLAEGKVADTLSALQHALHRLLVSARQGALMNRGAQIVITGVPNAGKSSLLNCLAKDDIAIVTNIPGTTRDVIRQTITVQGIAIEFSDTAGIRDARDEIEKEGIHRAHNELQRADIVLEVIDDTATNTATVLTSSETPSICVYNKIDLSGRPAGTFNSELTHRYAVGVSATTGEGIAALEQLIVGCLGLTDTGMTSAFSARERHVVALQQTTELLEQAITQFNACGEGELLAEDLRDVHERLGTITGSFGADDLLGEIFASFCIGK
jgi:tRNA modification GTPase